MIFQLRFALKEVFGRPARSMLIVSIVAITLAGFWVTESLIEAMATARREALAPMANGGIDLIVTSRSSSTPNASNEKETINLEGKNLAPGQSFVEDNIDFNSISTLDLKSIGRLVKDDRISQWSPALLITASRFEGKAPDQIIIPEKSIDPLTAEEKQQIERNLGGDIRFLDTQKELLRLRDLILKNEATNEDKKQAELFGQKLTDIEFSYYPDRFKKFNEEEVRPPPIKAVRTRLAIAGIDVRKQHQGLLKPADIIAGRFFAPNESSSVILRQDFATAKGLDVAGTFAFKGSDYKVIGLAKPAAGLSSSQIYLPLNHVREMIKDKTALNMVNLSIKGAANVAAVKQLGARLLPETNIAEANQASAQLTGSLRRAEKITSGYAVAIALLIIVIAAAMIGLTVTAALAGRRSELGALRATGWSITRISSQVAVEIALQTALGAVAGVALAKSVLSLLQQLELGAGVAMRTLDAGITGGLGTGQVVVSLKPVLQLSAVPGVIIYSLGIAVVLGYSLALLYSRQPAAKMLAQLSE